MHPNILDVTRTQLQLCDVQHISFVILGELKEVSQFVVDHVGRLESDKSDKFFMPLRRQWFCESVR